MKVRNLILIALVLCLSAGLKAQDKYEQAIVTQGTGIKGYIIYVSVEGHEYKEILLEKGKKKNSPDNSAIIDYVAQMRNEGWEVWNANYALSDFGATYFLRRKIK